MRAWSSWLLPRVKATHSPAPSPRHNNNINPTQSHLHHPNRPSLIPLTPTIKLPDPPLRRIKLQPFSVFHRPRRLLPQPLLSIRQHIIPRPTRLFHLARALHIRALLRVRDCDLRASSRCGVRSAGEGAPSDGVAVGNLARFGEEIAGDGGGDGAQRGKWGGKLCVGFWGDGEVAWVVRALVGVIGYGF
jgi:hypothetical protein